MMFHVARLVQHPYSELQEANEAATRRKSYKEIEYRRKGPLQLRTVLD
jgi:hypothetical protein